MKRIEKRQILLMHSITIEEYGGLPGVRDEKLLDSALNAPFQTFDSEELYPSVVSKAASLCYGIVNNHAFFDGNKRIGVLALVALLRVNNLIVEATDDEWIQLGLQIASGETDVMQITEWIIKRMQIVTIEPE